MYAVASLNANAIREEITATLYDNKGNVIDTKTYSADEYLEKLLAKTSDEKIRNMALATQLYGLSAENYFNSTNNQVEILFSNYRAKIGLSDDQIKKFISDKTEKDTITPEMSVSLVLNAKVKLRVYHENGEHLNSNGKYSEITDLTPVTMGQPHEIAGYTLSGYTWVRRVLNNPDTDQKNKNMAYAMFAYMNAGEEFDK